MSMQFVNNYPSTIWTAIMWYHPGCADGGDWEKAGWWQLEPGGSATVYGGDVDDVNRFWYYFGHAADGAVWAGDFPESVPDTRFDWCIDTSSTSARTVGMRQFEVDADNYTLTFTP
jgi:uncharacterized membrane protein